MRDQRFFQLARIFIANSFYARRYRTFDIGGLIVDEKSLIGVKGKLVQKVKKDFRVRLRQSNTSRNNNAVEQTQEGVFGFGAVETVRRHIGDGVKREAAGFQLHKQIDTFMDRPFGRVDQYVKNIEYDIPDHSW